MNNIFNNIANKFCIAGKIISIKPLGEGFINETLLITTALPTDPDYILQRKNKNIFQNIPAMMDNIQRVTTHLKKKIIAAGGNPMRESMTLIPTKEGQLYYKDEQDEFWTVSMFINDTLSYQKADTPALAYQGGKGIGRFQAMMADFKEPLADILPGFHNIRYRFKQWDEILAKDPAGRKASLQEEIQWIEQRREEMLTFWGRVENGSIPTRVTHNDTKINNILFDKQGNIQCVIDLDTVLSSTCLNDFGDAIRSYTNTGLEDDQNLNHVSSDIEIFRGYTQGYLSETAGFLNKTETDFLAFSARYITYEQVLRFLMDYIDGDQYYKIKYPQHNLVRTRAQYKLLQSIEAQYLQMCNIVKEEIERLKIKR